ncbi:BEM2 [[Candida] subhashii]|uniref:BEM2 n=1 Tax=[Candida] subhashii TaxID=561895 RepID=A0A8J5QPA4_9ASCO|nr:BEM2 [[Candida] subhashii]KAG7664050.1 BEM2 [[Candida] subhashii]
MRKIWIRKDKDNRRRSLSTSKPGNRNDENQRSSPQPQPQENTTVTYASEFDYYGIDSASSLLEASTLVSDKQSITSSQPTSVSKSRTHTSKISITSNNGYYKSLNPRKGSVSSISSLQNPTKLSSLIKPDFDGTIVKTTWVNAVVNNNEVSERNLRLFRAELKGAHLYLYKPVTNLNIKRFRLEEDIVENTEFDSESINSQSQIDPPTPPSKEQRGLESLNQSIPSSGSRKLPDNHSLPPTPLSALQQFPPRSFIIPESPISYLKTRIPHPDLKYDMVSHKFTTPLVSIEKGTGANSIEALVHFILFAHEELDEESVKTAINILPIFPDFGSVLRLFTTFLTAIFEGKFEGTINNCILIKRILNLLTNIEQNFCGFLLKSDIAPYILGLIEVITSNLDQETYKNEFNEIEIFKKKMLQKQQMLIELVNNDIPAHIQPFHDLKSTTFMSEINLIDFARSISEIDLKFFRCWNSDIDKSLLLLSSLNSRDSSTGFYKKNPLVFNNDHHIHYLSRLLISHLFLENHVAVHTSSVAETKARLLEKWIDLGCLLDKSGNMSSWLGISSIVLSQPVLRLTNVWSLVSSEYIKLLKNDWSPVLFELDRRFLSTDTFTSSEMKLRRSDDTNNADGISSTDSYHIMAPRGLGKIYAKEKIVPYFGDSVINNMEGTSATKYCSDIYELDSVWKRIQYSFKRWNDYISNLENHDEIISYNDDVLRRYDAMGFIFSNESLNQVLYLGANNENDKELPNTARPKFPIPPRSNQDAHITFALLKLIELNCESMNLEQIMKLSLAFEPELPEGYLSPTTSTSVVPQTPLELTFMRNKSQSNTSLNSMESGSSISGISVDGNEFNPNSRIPLFNNKFFKLDILKYDHLTPSDEKSNAMLLDPIGKHNFAIDDELTFRIDDFVTEVENLNPNSSFTGEFDDENHQGVGNGDGEEANTSVHSGLGLDVEGFLNSDQFTSIPSSPKRNKNGRTSTSGTFDLRKTYKFIPKFATMDKLIDLLLLDAKYFHEDIVMDLTEYRFVFLLNYTSFMTTKELLNKLAHRFINSGNAVISVMKKNSYLKKHKAESANGGGTNKNQKSTPGATAFDQVLRLPFEFPNWSLDNTADPSELGEVDYELLLKIQINVLKVLIVLVNNLYSNFSVDLGNKQILMKLLKLFSNEILHWYNSNKIDANLEPTFESLVSYYKKLKKIFVKKVYRPVEISKFEEYLINKFKFDNSIHEVPVNRNLPGYKNIHKIEKFLHKFNKLLVGFYKGIRAEDWVKVHKILENSFEKNCLLDYNFQKATTPDSNMIISNIFTYFESLVIPDQKLLLLNEFPLIFRKLFKLYFKFKNYLSIQICDSGLTSEERLDRMRTLLIMGKICRLKMTDNQFVFEGKNKGNIPSFIETAIINVIYSPSSRALANLWIKASRSLLGDAPPAQPIYYDDVYSLFPNNLDENDMQIQEPLLPCFGWIIENLIEMNKCPSFFKSMVNFNKRYLIFKLVRELTVEEFEGEEFTYSDSHEFDFLFSLDDALNTPYILREMSPYNIDDSTKLFVSVIREQRRILLADNSKKSIKDTKEAQNMSQQVPTAENNGSSFLQTISKKTSANSLKRQSLAYKTSAASRFKITGLFRTAKSFSLSNVPEAVVHFSLLPSPERQHHVKQKAHTIISLKNRKIFPVYIMPLGFKIDSEVTGESYFFQCTTNNELNDWLIKLNYANRHWFFSRSLNSKNVGGSLTFGVPISHVCARDGTAYPSFLEGIFQEIENNGIKDVGIYRISCAVTELANLKSTIDRIGTLEFHLRSYDTHALTSVVKTYFRELPDALLTDKVINGFFEIRHEATTSDESSGWIEKYINILMSLPQSNYRTFKLLIGHLNKVSQFNANNKMTASNLATVIGPALTEASHLEILVNNFGFMNSILERLIVNYGVLFEDVVETHSNDNSKSSMVREPSFDKDLTEKRFSTSSSRIET